MPRNQEPLELSQTLPFHPFAAFLVGLDHGARVLGRKVSLADLAEFSHRAGREWETVTIADLIIAADHYSYVNLEAVVALSSHTVPKPPARTPARDERRPS